MIKKIILMENYLILNVLRNLPLKIVSTFPYKLASLPDEIHSIISLLQLEIQECPRLPQRAKEDRHGDRAKIAHVPYALLDDEFMHYLSSAGSFFI